jgi:pyruvate/2-oxoglutarate dehydrogenase complex dihydrolipoamide acyltransferase (E2) component
VAHAFRLPDLGEGIAEAEILRWLVAEGDDVVEGQPLVEIHTDKATLEVPATRPGTLLQVVAPAGAIAVVGAVLAVVGVEGEQLLYAVQTPPGDEPAPRLPFEVVPDPPVALHEALLHGEAHPSRERAARIPVRGVRRAIVEQVSRAHREIPAVTFVEECDVSEIPPGDELAAAVAAVARALPDHPELNARLEGDAIVVLERIDIGVTVETDAGVVVPVLRGADRLDPETLRAELDRLTTGAREGELAPSDLRGSTFTVAGGGPLSGLLMTPLVHHPEVAILAVHRAVERAVVRAGEIVIRRIAHISVTFDHRAVDAPVAAAFCLDVIARLEADGPTPPHAP